MKTAVANRGEIAVRILKTLKEMRIPSVLLHSSEDKDSLAYRLADETLCIGSAESKDSYLNISHIIEGAKSAGAKALHPGVGFLSESSQLAEACRLADLLFIGPSAAQIKLFGHKVRALKHVQSLGLPTLPFYSSVDSDQALNKAKEMGFPVLIKLALGGGGVGIKKAAQQKDFLPALKSVQNMGRAVFGSSEVYLEKFLEKSRHIEVQIFGGLKGKVHQLFERDCSIQKRNQKIIEESPSFLDEETRKNILSTAQKIAESVQYQGAGTVEFLVQDKTFYFIEMNTRLQVEHPVTEMVLGVDLVRAQMLVKMGKEPFVHPLKSRGHSIECRIYSQDFEKQIPVSGHFGKIQWMNLPHSRCDMGYESYDRMPSYYDALIGKVIVWAETRPLAVEKMKCLLENSIVFGLPTNIREHLSLLNHPQFVENTFHLGSLQAEKDFPQLAEEEKLLIQQEADLLSNYKSSSFNPWFHHWRPGR